MTKYRIRFTSGELSGKTFDLTETTPLSIGRSRANNVCLKSPDISGRHLILQLDTNGVSLESLSLRKIDIDGTKVEIGARLPLNAGQNVQMGDSSAFILESFLGDTKAPESVQKTTTFATIATSIPTEDNRTLKTVSQTAVINTESTIIPKADSTIAPKTEIFDSPKTEIKPEVVAPKPIKKATEKAAKIPEKEIVDKSSAEDSNKTVAIHTRMATPEEIEFMRDAYAKTRAKKTMFSIGGIVLLTILIITIYFSFFHKEPERYLTWPRLSNGEYAIGGESIPTPFGKQMDFQFPQSSVASVKKSENEFEVETRIGRDSDVPLRVILSFDKNPDFLKINRKKTFEDWINQKKLGEGNWNFDLIQPLSFYESNNGIPYLTVQYTYMLNNELYFGVAEFFRIEDWRFVLRKEIPMRERWRGESFLKNEAMLFFARSLVYSHWEGFDSPRKIDPKVEIAEAKLLLSRNSPSVWGKVDFLLKNALVASVSGNDTEKYSQAISLLSSLRERQSEWYNAQRISYQREMVCKNTKAAARVAENCKAVFSSEEDLRFHKIRQNKWN